jgi:hypothetical protein
VHHRRCSCCHYIVRAAVPVLRSADRSCRAAAQDITGDCPEYNASGDDRPDLISEILVSNRVPNSVSDRFALGVRDGVPVTAFQYAPASGCRLSAFQLSHGQILADMLTSEGVSPMRADKARSAVLTC